MYTIQTWSDSDANCDEVSKISGLPSRELICRNLWYYVILAYTNYVYIYIYIYVYYVYIYI